MKIMIVTLPIRQTPTLVPPLAPLSLINYLRKTGFDGEFEIFDIDTLRPSYDEVLSHIREAKPDILGVSAVISTAYQYTKRLTLDIKTMLPKTLVVVGGNLAASAEILLRKTGTDICVLSEGELVFSNVVERARVTRDPKDFIDIPGLMLLDDENRLVNTGYEKSLSADQLYDICWKDLISFSDVTHFFPSPFEGGNLPTWLKYDARTYEPHRRNRKMGELRVAKGCNNRCTFCHRWDKGLRNIPVDMVISRLEELVRLFDVGFLDIASESFGANKRWLTEFCEKIKPLDILWRAGGVRASSISEEIVHMMKDAGCVALGVGYESGSDEMLKIMEKNVAVQTNCDAFKWCVDEGLWTGIQLVMGMPGETPETITDTIEFCKYVTALAPWKNPNEISINFVQALPGTPIYEYGRHKGLIARDLNGEEQYLLWISNKDAGNQYFAINFTDYPTLECRIWRLRINVEVNYNFVRKYGLEQYYSVLYRNEKLPKNFYKKIPSREVTSIDNSKFREQRSGSYSPKLWWFIKNREFRLLLSSYPIFVYKMKRFLVFPALFMNLTNKGWRNTLRLFVGYIKYKFKFVARSRMFSYDYKSLRKILEELGRLPGDSPEMEPLRRGR